MGSSFDELFGDSFGIGAGDFSTEKIEELAIRIIQESKRSKKLILSLIDDLEEKHIKRENGALVLILRFGPRPARDMEEFHLQYAVSYSQMITQALHLLFQHYQRYLADQPDVETRITLKDWRVGRSLIVETRAINIFWEKKEK